MKKMRGIISKSARIILATYVILFSSLIIHEAGHYVAEEYLVRECGVTNIVYSFDLLLIERHGLTYIACTDFKKTDLRVMLDINRITRPIFDLKFGYSLEGIGHKTQSGLVASALAGPLSELVYMTALVYLASASFPEYKFLRILYPFFLLLVFNSAEYDILYISPVKAPYFKVLYYGFYSASMAAYVVWNSGYYKRVWLGLLRCGGLKRTSGNPP